MREVPTNWLTLSTFHRTSWLDRWNLPTFVHNSLIRLMEREAWTPYDIISLSNWELITLPEMGEHSASLIVENAGNWAINSSDDLAHAAYAARLTIQEPSNWSSLPDWRKIRWYQRFWISYQGVARILAAIEQSPTQISEMDPELYVKKTRNGRKKVTIYERDLILRAREEWKKAIVQQTEAP